MTFPFGLRPPVEDGPVVKIEVIPELNVELIEDDPIIELIDEDNIEVVTDE